MRQKRLFEIMDVVTGETISAYNLFNRLDALKLLKQKQDTTGHLWLLKSEMVWS
jgi:hypothetical protein